MPNFGSDYSAVTKFVTIYTVLGSVMILNFLIAIFSDSVGSIMKNRVAISTVQKLTTLLKIETTFRMWPFMERFYGYQQRKFFDSFNGRLLLKVEQDC